MNSIREALQNRQLCIVVGTGVTSSATSRNPLASWRGLIEDGLDRCLSLGARDAKWVARAKEDVNSGYENDLIVAAEKATDGLGGRRDPEYATWLRETVGSLKATDTTLLDAIKDLVSAGAIVATTNYDDLLEDTLGLPSVTWRDTPRLQRVLREREKAVIHLHGHWSDAESVVFGSSSYADVLRSPESANFLRATVYVRTLLFVGFGAGLDDPNFSALRRWMSQDLTTSTFAHYRLVLDSEVTAPHAADRIVSVPYGDDYTKLPAYLASILAGLRGGGMRAAGDVPGANDAGSGPRVPGSVGIPLRSREDPALRAELSEVGAKLEWLAQASLLTDDEAVDLIGSGTRVDVLRRFVYLFEEEISGVIKISTNAAALDPVIHKQALISGRRLLSILGGSTDLLSWGHYPASATGSSLE
ncbi:SIR2 family NAD-dependent protein deacylase [Modestobacter sp. VKM Ac-2985]|uniref:SIR2 family NAD-dependent protein deacylase n=1 Tax=Modestobacter sp. VKM Ac-2985 TaxID=3004139 RepID=UPI0022ABA918|nr:SIR2 family protein [Modestobacter sp. VKM Ac-2985]MCZ2835951.1 SIR2 family protein [Modestobacter sp. VKM Ac-2985]